MAYYRPGSEGILVGPWLSPKPELWERSRTLCRARESPGRRGYRNGWRWPASGVALAGNDPDVAGNGSRYRAGRETHPGPRVNLEQGGRLSILRPSAKILRVRSAGRFGFQAY